VHNEIEETYEERQGENLRPCVYSAQDIGKNQNQYKDNGKRSDRSLAKEPPQQEHCGGGHERVEYTDPHEPEPVMYEV
jgi:hypothetical protein